MVKNSELKMSNLERGLSILELLAEHPDGLGTSEMARRLDYPKNFVFRSTAALYQRGYLTRNEESKKFMLSRKLLSMGYAVLQKSGLIESAMPVMRELRDEVRETVVLCTIEEAHGLVLDHVPGLHSFRLVVDTGMHFELHSSAPGKAILANLSAKERDRIMKVMRFTRFNDNTITTKTAFTAELEEVRKTGYALDRAEELDGIHCVSAPVFNQKGEPIAAVTVTGPSNRLPAKKFPIIGTMLKAYADQISTKLGYGV
ncbi:MAG: IclR family transcriptional regulator [Kiritimatiellales bacterium]|nr:IclR family transcriptional regulator [Kiritimatiellales bacterium]